MPSNNPKEELAVLLEEINNKLGKHGSDLNSTSGSLLALLVSTNEMELEELKDIKDLVFSSLLLCGRIYDGNVEEEGEYQKIWKLRNQISLVFDGIKIGANDILKKLDEDVKRRYG